MIEVTKMDSRKMFINEELIEAIEETPDTVIRMSNGNKYIVREKAADLMERIIAFRKS